MTRWTIFFSTASLIFTACNYSDNKNFVATTQTVPADTTAIIDSLPAPPHDSVTSRLSDTLEVIFEHSFVDDTVSIFSSNAKIYSSRISTDDRLGLASTAIIDRKNLQSNSLKIRINNINPIQVREIEKYNYILVRFLNGEIYFSLTNKQPRYK